MKKITTVKFLAVAMYSGNSEGLLFSERMSAVLLKYIAVNILNTALATRICYIVRATSPFGLFP